MRHIFVLIFVALLLFSCSKTEVEYLSVFDPYSEDGEVEEDSFGSVIYYDPFALKIIHINSPLQITQTLQTNVEAATKLSLTHDKSKYAYINEDGDIEVRSIGGSIIDIIDESGFIRSLDWTSNGKTIIYISDNQVKTWGESFTLPDFSLISGLNKGDLSISIDNDIAIVYYGTINIVYQFRGIAIFKNNGSEFKIELGNVYPYEVNFSNTTSNYLSSIGDASVKDIYAIREDNTIFTVHDYFYNEVFNSVCSDAENMVFFIEEGDDDYTNLVLKSSDLGVLRKLTDFKSEFNYLSFDWKL